MGAWLAVIVFDIALVAFGREALSGAARRFARAHPRLFAAAVGFVLAHWLRGERFAPYDPLSRFATLLGRLRPPT